MEEAYCGTEGCRKTLVEELCHQMAVRSDSLDSGNKPVLCERPHSSVI